MFEPSMKVIVIASSTTKSVGARHGSIGYITNCGQPEYIGDLYVGEATVAVAPATILFTRYGFGKERERYERKSALVVFPIFPEPSSKELPATERVNSFIKKFKREKFNESQWYNTKSAFSDRPENVDVCMVAPYPVRNCDLLNSSDAEFEAWFDSIILSGRMRITLDKISFPKYAAKFPKSMRPHLTHLRDCATHKDARREYLWALRKTPKLKKIVIETLRMAHCVGCIKYRTADRKSTVASYQRKAYFTGKTGRIKPGIFYRMFIGNVFNDQAFEHLDNLFKSFSIKDRFLISKSVRDTKSTLQNMASILSCR